MARKIISIICYVVAGFFTYGVNLMAFFDPSSAFPPPQTGTNSVLPSVGMKFVIMGVMAVPGLVFLGIGLLVSRFRKWKRDTGIVLVSGAGVAAMAFFTGVCMYFTPELRELDPQNKALSFFRDLPFGIGCLALSFAVGVILIIASRHERPKGYEDGYTDESWNGAECRAGTDFRDENGSSHRRTTNPYRAPRHR